MSLTLLLPISVYTVSLLQWVNCLLLQTHFILSYAQQLISLAFIGFTGSLLQLLHNESALQAQLGLSRHHVLIRYHINALELIGPYPPPISGMSQLLTHLLMAIIKLFEALSRNRGTSSRATYFSSSNSSLYCNYYTFSSRLSR